MEEFQCKTTIYSGPGAVSALAGMGGERLMLVTDPFFMKNGTAQRIAQTAKCAQVEYFDKVQPDPSVELAAEGTARLKEFAPDLLVALGGAAPWTVPRPWPISRRETTSWSPSPRPPAPARR